MSARKSTDPDKMVAEIEKTDMDGTLGHLEFYGRNDQFTHALKYGPGFTTGVFMQWQDGKQVCIWPANKCPSKMVFPSFVKLCSRQRRSSRQAHIRTDLHQRPLPDCTGSWPSASTSRTRAGRSLLGLQILIDGFAISSLYGLGAIGFTLMFGVSGVLNLAHGGIMLIAALFGW